MNNDLIERYVYAVTKRMNRKQRDDVAQELRSLIDDMLAERCGEEAPTEKDVRVVLTELGTPQELYAKYDEDADKCLIGQPYYSTYKFVMKIVLAAVTIGILISSVMLQIMEPKGVFEAIGTSLSMVYNSLLSAFAIVTLLFAFFHHKGVKLTEPFSFDDLPPVPKKKQEVSVWESVGGIALSVVFLIVFLAAPQIFSAVVVDTGELVPIFDVNVIRSRWYIIVLFAVIGITREAVKLMEKQYNRKVMLTAIVSDILSAVLSIWWLAGDAVINPEFKANMLRIFVDAEEFVYKIFENFNLFFLAVLLFALLLDALEATVRTLRK